MELHHLAANCLTWQCYFLTTPKHPLYTGVALLVLPWIGFLFNTWLGVLIGIILYIGSRIFSPEEEEILSKTFGTTWDEYDTLPKRKGRPLRLGSVSRNDLYASLMMMPQDGMNL